MRKKLNTKETLAKLDIKSANTLRTYWKAKLIPQPIRPAYGKNAKLFWYEDELDEYLEGRRGAAA